MPHQATPILSFFSGAGGLDFGFSREQFKVLLACDNFPAAIASYNFNAKRKIARQIDLSEVHADDLSRILDEVSPDLTPVGVVGGPPCQGFSRGNVQKDPRDPRNFLPFRYAEILAALNKRYCLKFFVFENVMGLMTPKYASRFESIRRAFRKAGFRLFHHDLDAQNFGVPQLRRRLFLVGLNKELFSDTEFVFPAGHVRKVTVRDTIAGLPEPAYFERGLKPSDIAYHPNHWTMMPKSEKFQTKTSAGGRERTPASTRRRATSTS